MAFGYTKNSGDATGKAVLTGSFTNGGGSTGGAIATGLGVVEYFGATGDATGADIYASISGGTVTMTCKANLNGTWMAIGR